ncbi:ParB/RepB/Spo0J family partition protein [Chitinophaga sp. MM2321]|uniref:ParB/RepB/Spo0J family partition protein n=1 Tax=Chitinophaga sp. MM2321 TaxID=3137178 RepID=UPI0032D582E8
MTTINKKLKTTTIHNRKPLSKVQSKETGGLPELTEGIHMIIPTSAIDLSPRKNRTYISQQAVKELGADIAVHGVISSLTVRQMATGRYELVAGERRFRAAQLIQLESLPVVVRTLTDQQAREIQLSENLHREDPHPLDESNGIAMLQSEGMSIDEIVLRLGKSKSFIYNRIKLAQLAEELKELFFADKINLSEATEIANLSSESQNEFFVKYCGNWEDESFALRHFKDMLSKYKYDLTHAPFDISDSQLIPNAGPCGSCPFNSATLHSLFPEMAKQSNCTNKSCYKNKCLAHAEISLRELINEHQPAAILVSGSLSDDHLTIIESMPETMQLPQYSYYEVKIIHQPSPPDVEDYTEYLNEDEEDHEQEETIFDQQGYDQAMQEYEGDLSAYQEMKSANGVIKALHFTNRKINAVLFTPFAAKTEDEQPKVTAKQVQEAIKAGTVTAELLQGEIQRIQEREIRAKEIDRDKIQLKLQSQFSDVLSTSSIKKINTLADITAIRLLVYLSLGYQERITIDNTLFADIDLTRIPLYERLSNLTPEQFCLMLRKAIVGKAESKIPNTIIGIALYAMAKDSGFKVEAIEKEQAQIEKDRLKKLKPRIKDLESRIKRLSAKIKKPD